MSVDYVELGPKGNVVKIFHDRKEASKSPAWDDGRVTQREHASAVAEIRRQVLKRANYECEHCGTPITWEAMHMHEKRFKSQGGHVSLRNCAALCYECHEGRADAVHGTHARPKSLRELPPPTATLHSSPAL